MAAVRHLEKHLSTRALLVAENPILPVVSRQVEKCSEKPHLSQKYTSV